MSVTFTFVDQQQMAAYFSETARRIRSRVPSASKQSQAVMRAEAHAYEQAAMIAGNSTFTYQYEGVPVTEITEEETEAHRAASDAYDRGLSDGIEQARSAR